PAGELPIPVPPASLDEGPHLSYAFQWFFFSVGTVVAYGLILRRQLRPRHEEAAV
ncbi:MAG: SURF1 family protein, partial [Actinobacteria bacterium]|nr:SURF1 family protein [Actinomycetota bacterium]NIS35368.1 SURF1 family protein [Actinomycetota bacterium]NIT98083.1 SURF1 family protein [Actinomycetota bacterium]NIU21718.1 SURF1 family protein [Actinomycetota bacterium]NIU70060.1 SURF1 family protein [Actinomycetota bacterium]